MIDIRAEKKFGLRFESALKTIFFIFHPKHSSEHPKHTFKLVDKRTMEFYASKTAITDPMIKQSKFSLCIPKIMSMIRKHHNHEQQTNPWHCEEAKHQASRQGCVTEIII